jgi:hypothetical protein
MVPARRGDNMTIFAFAHKLEIRRGTDRAETFMTSQAIPIGRGSTGPISGGSAKGNLKNRRTVP